MVDINDGWVKPVDTGQKMKYATPLIAERCILIYMECQLKNIANKHLRHITPLLEEILLMQADGRPFKECALGIIMQAEEKIPGAGIHYSIIKDNFCSYPADYKFEMVVRPLRYSLNELGDAYTGFSSARYPIITSGGHLEGCLKILINKNRSRNPLGILVRNKKVKKLLGEELIAYLALLAELAVNPAKHEYKTVKLELGPINHLSS